MNSIGLRLGFLLANCFVVACAQDRSLSQSMGANIRLSILLLSLVASSAARAEICRDVEAPFIAKTLDISLQPEFKVYAPGEIVRFFLRFENKGLTPLTIPEDSKGLFPVLEPFQWVGKGDDAFWHPLSEDQTVLIEYAGAIRPPAKKPDLCESTVRPRVLLPGDVHHLLLSDAESWKAGSTSLWNAFMDSASFTPLRAKRYEVSSGDFIRLSTEIKVAYPESYDQRCLQVPNETSSSERFRCRDVVIVKLSGNNIVLLGANIHEFENERELTYFKSQHLHASKEPAFFPFYERLSLDSEAVSFQSQDFIIPAHTSGVGFVDGAGKTFRQSMERYKTKRPN